MFFKDIVSVFCRQGRKSNDESEIRKTSPTMKIISILLDK